jgi:hypothetical protein
MTVLDISIATYRPRVDGLAQVAAMLASTCAMSPVDCA